jgi:trans-aconitate 2-methyltransferase
VTKQAHEWNSQAYHKVSHPQFGWGLKVLERLELRGDERVMDAGCGSGRLTVKLLERLPRGEVVGVDLSHNMLVQASEHVRNSPGKIKFVQADLAHLPFENEFDVVFSSASFHWVPDHEALFESLARSLKPGGRLEAQCGGGPNLRDVHRRVHVLMESSKYAQYFEHWKSPWEFADAETTIHRLRHAGFVDVESWLEASPIRFGSADEYKAFIEPVILRPFLNAISKETLREEFVDDLVTEAVRDSEFQLDYWRLNIRARKARERSKR